MKKPVDDSYHPPAPNFYENRGEVLATRANLPHWNKEITASFVTFRLSDSLPREELLKRLERKGIDLGCDEATGTSLPHLEKGVTHSRPIAFVQATGTSLPHSEATGTSHPRSLAGPNGEAASSPLQEEVQNCLDAGYGSCVLRDETCRQIVEDALWHFAGERYHLYAYIVMPNHVHVLFQPMEGRTLSRIVADWKSYTAHKINELRGTDGTVWQKESFDTLVRSQRHFQTVVSYIRKNDLTRAWVAYH